MNSITRYTLFGSLAVLTFACASTPKQDDAVADARATITRVENMPLAGEVAAKEIETAHSALYEAERLQKKDRSSKEIANAAYLAKRHAEIAEQQIAAAEAKKKVEAGEKERQAVLLSARAEEADRNAKEADQAKRETDEAKRKIEMLQQELSALNAKQTDRGLVLTLGDVLFDTAQASMKPGAISAVERLAKFLKDSPEHTVVIEGHTDSVGAEDYNQALSQRRADAVREALVSRGVTTSHVEAVGKGEAFPIASNDSAGGRQQNRRVEIIIDSPAPARAANR